MTYMCNECCVSHNLWLSTRYWAKVDVPNFVLYLDRTPISEWYVTSCGFTKEYQEKHVFNF